ncbi:MAG: DUF488 domain-containing protein [Clostridia bacterium]|nr:DUF488 domain-containing protein [Clostridia bacterium]MBQ6467395.1 DUF488 domain-containing protein [Clostridia bacterium]
MIMNKLFTIGFTKKTAEEFIKLLDESGVCTVIDIRLNNTSQLAGFSKFPDIEFFLNSICGIKYIYEPMFSPSEKTLKRYKKKEIDWNTYKKEFNQTMNERNISALIKEEYLNLDNVCLLCSEPTPEYCHRSLIAERFFNLDNKIVVKHL